MLKREFIPVREEKDWSYTAEQVVQYVKEAYGEGVKLSDVPLNLSYGGEAVTAMGYGYEEEDGWFEGPSWTDNLPSFVANKMVTRSGAVGLVTEIAEGPRFSLAPVIGWKRPEYTAWWCLSELRQFTEQTKE